MSQTDASKAAPKPHDHVHEVKFVSYPKLLFTWPLLLAGLVFWPIAGWLEPGGLTAGDPKGWLEMLGWVYIALLFLVFMTLGVDVDRNQAVFWIVLLLLIWIASAYLEQVKAIPILGAFFAWFAGLNVYYDRNFGLAVSLILLVPFGLMLAYAYINDRWRITHNEFEHYSFGRMDESLGRGAKVIRTSYPDIFELVLGLAGTLVVYTASGNQELRRIPHVMFLPLVRKRLNKILERTAVVGAGMESEEEEEELT